MNGTEANGSYSRPSSGALPKNQDVPGMAGSNRKRITDSLKNSQSYQRVFEVLANRFLRSAVGKRQRPGAKPSTHKQVAVDSRQ